jgi:hypothetical protein
MKGVPTDIGIVHFVGIGGIGMSGIAEVMHNLGYQVQGSDIADSYVIDGLRQRGIKVMIGNIDCGKGGQPRTRRGFGTAHTLGTPRRNARRINAVEEHGCRGWHAWQDDDDIVDCGDAGSWRH